MQASPPQYPGAPYYPMATENLLKKRYVLALNALGLLAIWLAAIIVIWTSDLNARGFARFLTLSGGLGLQLLRRGRDRAAGRDDIVDDRHGLPADGQGLRGDLHRVRVDPLLLQGVERDAGDCGRLLRESNRVIVRSEEHVDLRGLEVPADRGHAANLARREREGLQNPGIVNRHRQQFVAIDREMLGDRLGRDRLAVEESLVLTPIPEVRDDGRDAPGARVSDRVGQQEEFDDHRARMGRLDKDDVLVRDGSEEAHIALAIGESARVLLECDVHKIDGEFAGDPPSEGDRRRAADNLHGGPGRVVWDVDI